MKKIWILILLIIIGVAGFVYFSPMFERIPPKIEIVTNGYTNLKKPLKIVLSDNTGIKYYSVNLITSNGVKELASAEKSDMGKKVVLNVKLPQNLTSKKIKIHVTAVDISKWHFFAGNETQKTASLIVDTTPPLTQIISNSYAIGQGGAAAVVVEVADKNLKDAYILVDGKYKFKLTPFVKKNYYVALIAWPIYAKKFDAQLVAIDKAGNESTQHVPLYWRNYKYPYVKIKITDNFIKTVAVRVLRKMHMSVPSDPVEIFKKVNETVRKMNNAEISKLTSKIYENKVSDFSMARFNPLPGSAVKAWFGERRHYFYHGKQISFAIHRGMDLAKVRHSKEYASNYGRVTAEKYIGIYGNVLIIYHKLGLYTLFAHTSAYRVKVGDIVRRGEVVAISGATGAVFGDHLHFGVYIQGYAVNPKLWMDPHWIRVNIINVINGAKRLIK